MEEWKLGFVLWMSCCVLLSTTFARPSKERDNGSTEKHGNRKTDSKETISSNSEDEYCITSCRSKENGDYQSCEGCQVYIACNEQEQLNVQCPPGLVWDDIDKNCVMMSKTCYSDDMSMVEILDDSNEIEHPDSASAVSLPENFNLKFAIEGTSMTLNLSKNGNVHSMTPIFTAENGRMKTMSPKQEEFGVYKDIATRASFIVKMKQDLKGKMTKNYEGLFRMDNEDYFIHPSPQLGSEQHTILKRSLESVKHGSKQHQRLKRSLDQISSGKSYMARKMRHISEEMDFDNIEMRPENANISMLQDQVMQDAKDSNSLPSGFQRYKVDVLLFVDYAVYNKWYKLSTKSTTAEKEADAIQNIRFYYSHVMNGVDLRYNSIEDSSLEIEMKLQGIFIAMTGSDSPWTQYNRPDDYYHTEAYDALDAFELWLNSSRSFLPSFDLAALFSGYRLYSGKRSDGSLRTIGGLADIKGACRYKPVWYGASINYDSGLYSATQTVTHEMGHNLGSFHDGDSRYAASCTGRDRYIMASAPGVLDDTTYKNAFKFSPCSVRSIREYLMYLTMEGENCLTEENEDPFTPVDTTILFGQIFDPDHQCRQIYGEESFYCAGGDKDAGICRDMACFNPKLQRCSINAEQRAADGTTCGNTKWCNSGICVFHPDAPSAPESCIYGDFKDPFQPSGLMCDEIIRKEPYLCYRDDYRIQCCSSCENMKRVNKTECEYGDHDDSCKTLTTSHCIQQSKRESCCEECPKRSTGIEGCEFGDTATWCNSNIEKGYNCYGQNMTCCQTCARFQLPNADPDCWYGDKVSWCAKIKSYQCYDYNTRKSCCSRCKQIVNENDQECKYGDRVVGCQVSDCQLSWKIGGCCHTCRGNRTIMTTTTTAATTTTTPKTTAATKTPSTSTLPGAVVDKRNDCAEIIPESRHCYYYSKECQKTCEPLFTNIINCEYGDRVGWCENWMKQNGAQLCANGHDPTFPDNCCLSCLTLGNATTTKSTVTTTTVVPTTTTSTKGCVDAINWCDTYIDGHYERCHNPETEQLCCLYCEDWLLKNKLTTSNTISTTSANITTPPATTVTVPSKLPTQSPNTKTTLPPTKIAPTDITTSHSTTAESISDICPDGDLELWCSGYINGRFEILCEYDDVIYLCCETCFNGLTGRTQQVSTTTKVVISTLSTTIVPSVTSLPTALTENIPTAATQSSISTILPSLSTNSTPTMEIPTTTTATRTTSTSTSSEDCLNGDLEIWCESYISGRYEEYCMYHDVYALCCETCINGLNMTMNPTQTTSVPVENPSTSTVKSSSPNVRASSSGKNNVTSATTSSRSSTTQPIVSSTLSINTPERMPCESSWCKEFIDNEHDLHCTDTVIQKYCCQTCADFIKSGIPAQTNSPTPYSVTHISLKSTLAQDDICEDGDLALFSCDLYIGGQFKLYCALKEIFDLCCQTCINGLKTTTSVTSTTTMIPPTTTTNDLRDVKCDTQDLRTYCFTIIDGKYKEFCRVDDILHLCCQTCKNGLSRTTTYHSTSVQTSTITTTPVEVETTTTNNGDTDSDSNCPNAVDTDWCATYLSENDYAPCNTDGYVKDNCCNECTNHKINNPGKQCPNAIDASWCDDYLHKNGNRSCGTDLNVQDNCCNECKNYGTKQTNMTCPNAVDTSWCGDHFVKNGHGRCANDDVRKQCCNECKTHFIETNDPDCPYGDEHNWCEPRFCYNTRNRKECCVSCRS